MYLIFTFLVELILVFVGSVFLYFFIIKPYIVNPFREGLKGKTRNINYKKYNSQKSPWKNLFKEKGDAFEQFVAKMFDKKLFIIREWRGDKFIDGIYAESNKNPDFEIEFVFNNVLSKFAVECKYRTAIHDRIIIAEKHKINNYRKYSAENNIPVFIALGLSGLPTQPNEFYIIPLNKINSEEMDYYEMQKFRRASIHNKFYYDPIELTLA